METPLFCDRCSTELHPGAGNFYVVSIQAVADPTAAAIPEARSPEEIHEAIQQILAQLEGTSAQEALDQVYRRLTLHLCRRCFSTWIENPTGD